MNNQIKTILLLSFLSILFIFIGSAIGGRGGMYMALLFALALNGISYFFSDKIALMASGAKPLAQQDAPELYQRTQSLSQRAGIPMPKLYLTPELQSNAFATGRDPAHASVAVTQGLLNNLSLREVEAVIAHELAHVKNRDILISSIAAVIASAVGFLANMLMYSPMHRGDDDEGGGGFGIVGIIVMAILAPLVSTMIQMAISRAREFEADATAKQLLGTGQPLADALRSIHASVAQQPNTALNPAYASMYIANPFGGAGGAMIKLFSTHPPVEERIQKLLQ